MLGTTPNVAINAPTNLGKSPSSVSFSFRICKARQLERDENSMICDST